MEAARRHIAWVTRHAMAIILVAFASLVASVLLAVFHLPLRADFSALLPDDAPAVVDLHALERRMTAQDAVLVVIVGADATTRDTAAIDLATAIRALPASLVLRVETDDTTTRDFLRARRHLFVPYDDLVRARDALTTRIASAKLAKNPLFIDLDDEPAATTPDFATLRQRRAAAEARLDHSTYVSTDGASRLVVVRTAFPRSAVASGKQLVAALDTLRTTTIAQHPGLDIGIAAGVVTAVAEHRALVRGMAFSSVITALLVGLVLVAFLRSLRGVAYLAITLVVGTGAAFGVAALAVGHLNVATAFLGAIIAGNGVNYGIILLARLRDHRREHEPAEALARAVADAVRPTLVAALGAAIAYGALVATSFRGFSDFAVIGSAGMLACWLATFTLLPALLVRSAPLDARQAGRGLGSALARLFAPRRTGLVTVTVAAIAVAATVIAVRYVARDPFEYDLRQLRSAGADAEAARHWIQLADRSFGRGIAGQTYIAVDDPAAIAPLTTGLRFATIAPGSAIGTVQSIRDVVPDRQPEKLVVLADIRRLLDDPALTALEPADRAELVALRPPDDLRAFTAADLPEELAVRLRERDGRIGYFVGVRPNASLDEYDGHDLLRFAAAMRAIQVPHQHLTMSGSYVIFADILDTIRRDGPRIVGLATLGLAVMVLLVVGRNRRAAAVGAATLFGTVLFVAVCALAGIRVTFLDFVALPITLGLGIDYAINLAHGDTPTEVLRTSGAAVVVCSLTTIIGYGSLLVSENLAIRGFGIASLVGELCCVFAALILVPRHVTASTQASR